jgi:hypothetical protein
VYKPSISTHDNFISKILLIHLEFLKSTSKLHGISIYKMTKISGSDSAENFKPWKI